VSRSEQQALIDMANQIAANLAVGPGDEVAAAERVADHLRRFWARRMKQQLSDYAREDGSGLSPLARAALARL
jgi:formate dehydrogenase subunit delta